VHGGAGRGLAPVKTTNLADHHATVVRDVNDDISHHLTEDILQEHVFPHTRGSWRRGPVSPIYRLLESCSSGRRRRIPLR
jgi:hypothetical protein